MSLISTLTHSGRGVALALLLIVPPMVHAADDAPGCPVGIIKCPKKPVSWEMCKKSDLLDFYIPGLPTTGDRKTVAQDVSALKVHSPDRTHYVLEGQAEIRQLDLVLRSDTITYDTETSDYSVDGNVRYQDRQGLMSATHGEGNGQLDQCTLDGVRYQLLDSRGNGTADVAVMDDVGHAHLSRATYSTCDLSQQSWAFSARDMDLDKDEGVGRAHDAVFRIHNVPIFWVPYLRFPLDNRRLSGFLYPSIGYGSERGLDLTVPYYFNIAPNYDATLLPQLMSERGVMLGGQFRYLTDKSTGEFNFNYMPDDREVDQENATFGDSLSQTRWWYQWKDTTTFGDDWGAAVNINRVSDDRYFQDFGRGLYNSAISFLPSSAYINGHGDWWSASIGGDEYQITNPSLLDYSDPYRRLPRATFTAEHSVLGDLTAGVNSEFVAFSKDNAVDGERIDLYPYLAYPIETSAYFIRPELGYRYTAYDLTDLNRSNNPLLTTQHPDRGVPIFSLDSGLIFERSLNVGGEAWTQTLEPRLYYLRVPYRDQSDLPVFDTQQVTFSFGELFRTNSFVGADRQMDANNLSLALTTRFLEDSSGEERLSASIGQILYFNDQPVQLPGRPTTDYGSSAYVGEVDLHLSDRWRLTLDQQWNPNTDQTDLSTFTLQNRFGNDGIVNFSYRYQRDFLDQVDLSAALPITPNWRLIARENYALNDPTALPTDPRGTSGRTLEQFFGIEHESCCIIWRAIARHWIHDAAGDYDNALYFEVEFKGIGSFGQKTDTFLRRGILGYQ